MIKISVLIPVYNVELYLRQCLDSVIGQTYTNLEIICIDDGSTDGSGRTLDEYAQRDARIRVLHKKNTGYGHSMNLALEMATGDYIGIVESDDYISDNMYDRMVKVLEEESTVLDIVKSNYYEFTEDACAKRQNLKEEWCGRVIKPEEYMSLFDIPCSIWSAIYRRDFLVRQNICFLETPGASYQDTGFVFKAWITAEKVFLLNDALVFYRKDNAGSSVNSSKKIFCVCKEIMEIERYMQEYQLRKPYQEGGKGINTFRMYMWNYYRLPLGVRAAFFVEMIQEFRKIERSPGFHREYWEECRWKEIHSILDDPEKFFWESNRELMDMELDRLTIKNTIYQESAVEYLKKSEKIIIYGAGVYGRRVLEFLDRQGLREKVFCFAVTDLTDNLTELDGIAVCPAGTLLEWGAEAVVIVAVAEKRQQEILQLLKRLEFSKVIRVDREFLEVLWRKDYV
ncbi:MAG: glycosyltransferase [Lachnospiraceae bacterium]